MPHDEGTSNQKSIIEPFMEGVPILIEYVA